LVVIIRFFQIAPNSYIFRKIITSRSSLVLCR